LVGVISQPSATRTLMLPDEPAVKPRPKIEAPVMQIASRGFASFMPRLLFSRICGHCEEPQATRQSCEKWRARRIGIASLRSQ
jgi:hypothetical protein